MIFFSPLDQFEITILFPIFIRIFTLDLSITTMVLYLILVMVSAFLFLFFGVFRAKITPFFAQSFAEMGYRFIYGIVKQQTGQQGEPYFPIFFVLFFFILFSNSAGLIGFSFTPTAHIAITLIMALSLNYGFIHIGLQLHKIHFFNLFIPKGINKGFMPLLIVVEVLSYLLRTVSLSVRLFANMMAGHTLLFIFASFIVAFLNSNFMVFGLVPFLLLLAIYVLEVGIAFLQSYVFVLLATIYLNDSFHPQH